MLFNSIHYVIFLPVVLIVYFISPFKHRWLVLLLASCYFYMSFIPVYLLILVFTIVIDYFVGIYLEKIDPGKKRALLIVSLVANLSVLFIFKYFNFFTENFNALLHTLLPGSSESYIPVLSIILPIGLSFHTFQSMSYIIEVFLGRQKAEKHFGYYWLYVMYFPQLVAGPIERPQNLIGQLHANNPFLWDRFIQGAKIIIIGFFMKIVVSDRLSIVVDQVYGDPHSFGSKDLILATYFFAFQIYCDFAGYSYIAIGTSRIFGIKLMENFNFPYFSSSITEFWTRWHISLSGWFKDYLYIPLGGSRIGRLMHMRNLVIVFAISGLWHGANWTFLIWGFLHAGLAIFETILKMLPLKKVFSKNPKNKIFTVIYLIKIAIVFHLVLISWVFFRAKNLQDALYILNHFFDFSFRSLQGLDFQLNIKTGIVVISLLLLIDFLRSSRYLKSKTELIHKWKLEYVFYSFLIISIFLGGVFHGSSFIYFQF